MRCRFCGDSSFAALLILELELLADLVHDLHAARLDALVDRRQFRGFGLEVRERGEHLARCDEAALAAPRDELGNMLIFG